MLSNQRALFDIPDDVAYFNCASLAPLMHSAAAAGEEAIRRRTQPWGIVTNDWFDPVERRRSLFASLTGCRADNVALVPATSYGLAVAARNLSAKSGQSVLVIAEDYPSNIYTWRKFCARHACSMTTVARAPDEDWTTAVLKALNENVAVVAVPNVHWTDGGLLDLERIAVRVREVGARLVIDASQSFGAMPFDFAAIRPDFLVAVGYKWLLGPFGLGYLYVADEHLDGEPIEENWIAREASDDFARLIDYRDTYQGGARRFDVGQRSLFETTPIAVAALEQLNQWGVQAISETLAAKTDRIAQAAQAIGIDVTTALRGPHMLGLKFPSETIGQVAAKLTRADVHVGVRGSAIRIAPHVYTSDTDIDLLIATLADR